MHVLQLLKDLFFREQLLKDLYTSIKMRANGNSTGPNKEWDCNKIEAEGIQLAQTKNEAACAGIMIVLSYTQSVFAII
jgi:hypothetical protein